VLYRRNEASISSEPASSELISEKNSSVSAVLSVSSSAPSATSSKKTVSAQLTIDWFDLSLYEETKETTVFSWSDKPCVLIPDGNGGWKTGTEKDLAIGDMIVMIDDAAAGECIWRLVTETADEPQTESQAESQASSAQ